MVFNIRGNKIEVTEAIKAYIEKRIGRLDKYFENPSEMKANVLVHPSGVSQVVEVTIPAPKVILRAEDRHKDLFTAIDGVVEKLERQIRKNKTKRDLSLIVSDTRCAAACARPAWCKWIC